MLVAAKWRDFCQQNPHQEQPDFEANEEPEYQPKTSTSRHKVRIGRFKYVNTFSYKLKL